MALDYSTAQDSIQDASRNDLDKYSFKEDTDNLPSRRACITNDDSNPIPIEGTISDFSVSEALKAKWITVGAAAVALTTGEVTDTRFVSILNNDTTKTLYIEDNTSFTADQTATGGWPIGPGVIENIAIQSGASVVIYGKVASGSISVCIKEGK